MSAATSGAASPLVTPHVANAHAGYNSLLLQRFRKPPLDARGLGLDVIVVHRVNLDLAERRVALRAGNVGASRIQMLVREKLLHRPAQHEFGKGLRRVR